MDWREGAARVAFVIADAPPHMDYQEDVSYGRAAAAAAQLLRRQGLQLVQEERRRGLPADRQGR